MNDLCADIGYKSINHFGEQLCGDHVDVVEEGDRSSVIVLADGLGSGVKASILSTLTSKIISTMMAEGLSLEDCVETIAATLPICSVRGVAYSTFTIIHLKNSTDAEIIQYDNPPVILLRGGKNYDYVKTEMQIGGKKIFKSSMKLCEGDIFVAMSDGCPHAGMGLAYNFGWKRADIIDFMETIADVGYTAKTLSTILVDECNRLYDGKPGDDATAAVIRIRRRVPMNILFGPPSNRDDCDVVYVPCNHIAEKLGNPKAANVVFLGAYIAKKPEVVSEETIIEAIRVELGERKAKFLEGNIQALKAGMDYVKSLG